MTFLGACVVRGNEASSGKPDRDRNEGSDAHAPRKWSEMRSQGIGRGKKLSKPKKTAADFAVEKELEKKNHEGEKPKEEKQDVEEAQTGKYSGEIFRFKLN